jgi:hypothetical protein
MICLKEENQRCIFVSATWLTLLKGTAAEEWGPPQKRPSWSFRVDVSWVPEADFRFASSQNREGTLSVMALGGGGSGNEGAGNKPGQPVEKSMNWILLGKGSNKRF